VTLAHWPKDINAALDRLEQEQIRDLNPIHNKHRVFGPPILGLIGKMILELAGDEWVTVKQLQDLIAENTRPHPARESVSRALATLLGEGLVERRDGGLYAPAHWRRTSSNCTE
jgi:hypothetical protein